MYKRFLRIDLLLILFGSTPYVNSKFEIGMQFIGYVENAPNVISGEVVGNSTV